MTKREARAYKQAWQQALAEGRVVRANDGMTLRSYPTVEQAQADVAMWNSQGMPAEIVIWPNR